jgi:hypothetical protein
MNEFYNLFNRSTSYSYRFRKIFDRFLWENRVALGENYYMLQLMMDSNNLATSVYNGDEFSVLTPAGKEIKVQRGCRPMRIISRVSKAYGGIDLLDEFQTEISQVLNQRKLKGTLTISIHPMDYMTMSENRSDWTSCMNWREGGCYCRGTVEMMNSDCVVVAYLASEEDMTVPGGYHWNNKKWRELFIVDESIIAGVKGYPYQNEELVQIVNSWLKELAEKNLGWKFDSKNFAYQHRHSFDYVDDNGEVHDAYIHFETDTMYNDFGSLDEHYAIFKTGLTNYNIEFNYSGQEICMECGSDSEYFDGEGCLVCEKCDGGGYTCYECGERIRGGEDNVYWLDDEPYCEYCYGEYAEEDDLSGDEHHRNNMRNIYFFANGENINYDSLRRAPYIRTYRHVTASYYWNRIFNDDAKYWSEGWDCCYYVTPEMFRDVEDIRRFFDIRPAEFDEIVNNLNVNKG